MKRSQVTIFVIIGLVVLLVIGAFITIKVQSERLKIDSTTKIDFANARASAKFYVDDCLEKITAEALNYYGLNSEAAISNYIDAYMPGCVDEFRPFSERGYTVEFSPPSSSVEINEDAVLVALRYPVELSGKDDGVSLDEFQYRLRRNVFLNIQGGILPPGIVFSSADNDVTMYAAQNTKATKDGNPINFIGLNMLEKNFGGLSNDAVIGKVVYSGQPSGARFDPPLTVTIRMDKADLPKRYLPDSPKIGFYDEKNDIWRTYPALEMKEDSRYYYYSALVDHFTPIAIVACGQDDFTSTYYIPMGFVYRNLIEPSDTEYWIENDQGAYLIPELLGNATCTYRDDWVYNHDDPGENCMNMLDDWDEDDLNENVGDINIYSGDVELTDDNLQDTDLNDLKDNCYEACANKARWDLYYYLTGKDHPEKGQNHVYDITPVKKEIRIDFDRHHLTFDELISGDGIVDGIDIKCNFESTVEDSKHTVNPETAICVVDEEYNNLGPGLFEFRWGSFDDVSTMINLHKKTKFYATPKTYGYETVSGDGEQVGGLGYYTLELRESGNSCIDTYEVGVLEVNEVCSPSDICTWFLNTPGNFDNYPGSPDPVHNQLMAGINVVNVNVENQDRNAQAWGNADFIVKGKGLLKFEECGTTMLERHIYLTKCGQQIPDYGTKASMEINCLWQYAQLTGVDRTTTSLCDVDFTKATGVAYDCVNKFNYALEHTSTNGGRCDNGVMRCPDIVDDDDVGCMCGETEVNYDDLSSGKLYCCKNYLYREDGKSINGGPDTEGRFRGCRQAGSVSGNDIFELSEDGGCPASMEGVKVKKRDDCFMCQRTEEGTYNWQTTEEDCQSECKYRGDKIMEEGMCIAECRKDTDGSYKWLGCLVNQVMPADGYENLNRACDGIGKTRCGVNDAVEIVVFCADTDGDGVGEEYLKEKCVLPYYCSEDDNEAKCTHRECEKHECLDATDVGCFCSSVELTTDILVNYNWCSTVFEKNADCGNEVEPMAQCEYGGNKFNPGQKRCEHADEHTEYTCGEEGVWQEIACGVNDYCNVVCITIPSGCQYPFKVPSSSEGDCYLDDVRYSVGEDLCGPLGFRYTCAAKGLLCLNPCEDAKTCYEGKCILKSCDNGFYYNNACRPVCGTGASGGPIEKQFDKQGCFCGEDYYTNGYCCSNTYNQAICIEESTGCPSGYNPTIFSCNSRKNTGDYYCTLGFLPISMYCNDDRKECMKICNCKDGMCV
jgi:hypothetical protein